MDSARVGTEAFARLGVRILALLGVGGFFSGLASSSDLLSNLEVGEAESIALFQEQKPNAITKVVLQEPNLNAIS